MKAVIESARFPGGLGGWGLRGLLCAAASFCWALVAGFNDPWEIAGMAAGVAVWIALFAGFCVWHGLTARRGPDRLVPALKIAAWIKVAGSAAGGVLFAVFSLGGPKDTILDVGILGVLPDALLGWMAIGLTSQLAGVGFEQIPKLDSFGWTAVTTVVEGALFTLVIAVLAGAVLGWWRWGYPLLRKWKLSPVRCAG